MRKNSSQAAGEDFIGKVILGVVKVSVQNSNTISLINCAQQQNIKI